MAIVEISNEDALFTVWGRGELDDLPEPYATTFRKLWNAWLRKKYGNTEQLRKAWNGGRVAAGRGDAPGRRLSPSRRAGLEPGARRPRRRSSGRSRRAGREGRSLSAGRGQPSRGTSPGIRSSARADSP